MGCTNWCQFRAALASGVSAGFALGPSGRVGRRRIRSSEFRSRVDQDLLDEPSVVNKRTMVSGGFRGRAKSGAGQLRSTKCGALHVFLEAVPGGSAQPVTAGPFHQEHSWK